jgi:predicted dinucleotide-binding enzyme
MTTIGIIGSGHVGSSLARAAIAHGYDVVLSNSQGPDSLAGLVTELGPKARAATPAQAARTGDFAIVAIPLTTVDQVVRAFSMINAAEMSGDGRPHGDPERRALALAGDDPAAKQLVAGLYDKFGFDAVDIGGLDESWRIEAGQPAFVVRQNLAELTANVANAKRPA